jgi:hypothetical protein
LEMLMKAAMVEAEVGLEDVMFEMHFPLEEH